jgi:hypothetical protein
MPLKGISLTCQPLADVLRKEWKMSRAKEEVRKMLDRLPDDASLEDVA